MKLLFVCLGNICRSPLLEAVARERFARAGVDWQVASCGTGGWHAGDGADTRAVEAGRARGYALHTHRARQLRASDYSEFDYLLAADENNLRDLRTRAPAPGEHLVLTLPFCGIATPRDVPDPYYGGERDFQHVVDLAERVADSLLQRLGSGHTVAGARPHGRGEST
jgi:protein-tyrosine phosphatase